MGTTASGTAASYRMDLPPFVESQSTDDGSYARRTDSMRRPPNVEPIDPILCVNDLAAGGGASLHRDHGFDPPSWNTGDSPVSPWQATASNLLGSCRANRARGSGLAWATFAPSTSATYSAAPSLTRRRRTIRGARAAGRASGRQHVAIRVQSGRLTDAQNKQRTSECCPHCVATSTMVVPNGFLRVLANVYCRMIESSGARACVQPDISGFDNKLRRAFGVFLEGPIKWG